MFSRSFPRARLALRAHLSVHLQLKYAKQLRLLSRLLRGRRLVPPRKQIVLGRLPIGMLDLELSYLVKREAQVVRCFGRMLVKVETQRFNAGTEIPNNSTLTTLLVK